jgi:hypothetical protein
MYTLLAFNSYGQSGFLPKTVVLKNADTLIKASVNWQDEEIIYDAALIYYTYYNDKVHALAGGALGHLLDGPYQEALRNGSLLQKGSFNLGLKDGTWRYWDSRGYLLNEQRWKKGVLKEEKVFHSPNQSTIDADSSSSLPSTQKSYKLLITDDQSEALPNATIFVYNSDGIAVDSLFTDEGGIVNLLSDTADVIIKAHKNGYRAQSIRIYQGDSRETISAKLNRDEKCQQVIFRVEHATRSYPIEKAQLTIQASGFNSEIIYTDEEGAAQLCLPCNNVYEVSIEKNGFKKTDEKVELGSKCHKEPAFLKTAYLIEQ